MKVAALIARLLLGLVFLVFGLNGFLNFLPLPALTGLAGQFIDVLAASHFMVFVFTVEMLGGLLLLVNRFVPLALVCSTRYWTGPNLALPFSWWCYG
jgi:uncharacterized membrane protein YphA (DoxX/SURF4 family)